MRQAVYALAAGAAAMMPAVAEARAGDPIGAAVVVVNQVTAELSRDVRSLVTGDPVRHSELIVAGSDARTELKLEDDTKLALGAGARLRLDNFVYDPDKRKGAILVDLVKGTFRFITGVASKPSYVVRTPAAAITVRGTIFDVFVRENGETWLLLSEGGVKVCTPSGKCSVLDKPGRIIAVTADGEIGSPSCWQRVGGELDFSFDEAFPFVAAPPSVDENPVFTRAALTSDGMCGSAPKQRRTERGPPTAPTKAAQSEPRPKVVKTVASKPRSFPQPVKVARVSKPVKVVRIDPPRRVRPPIRVVELPPIRIRPPIILHVPSYPRKPDMGNMPYPGRDSGGGMGSIGYGGSRMRPM